MNLYREVGNGKERMEKAGVLLVHSSNKTTIQQRKVIELNT